MTIADSELQIAKLERKKIELNDGKSFSMMCETESDIFELRKMVTFSDYETKCC